MQLNADKEYTTLLVAGKTLVIGATSGTTGSVTRLAAPGAGDPTAPVAIDGVDFLFGPYAESVSFRVKCITGEVGVTTATPDPFAVHPSLAAYAATAAVVNALAALVLYGSGAPVNYTDGDPAATGEGVAPKGALYLDINPAGSGFVYRNSGTQAAPIWTKLADAV